MQFKSLHKALRRFARETSGALTHLWLATTIGLMMVGGLAIDSSNLWMMHNRMQIAADTAVLAGAREMPDTVAARAKALEYVEKNLQSNIFGAAADITDVVFGEWDPATGTIDTTSSTPNSMAVEIFQTETRGGKIPMLALHIVGRDGWEVGAHSVASSYGGACTGAINLGGLTDYLFVIADGSNDANWQGSSKGYYGDVAVDGLQADERTSGDVPYEGTIYTNESDAGSWQDILSNNASTSSGSFNQDTRISALEADLAAAFAEIDAMTVTPGFEDVDAKTYKDVELNFQDGVDETIVIDVTQNMTLDFEWRIRGDDGDLIVMRWDDDPTKPGYNGEVKIQSGGGVIPLGGLTPANFVHVAGKLNSSGGGSAPAELQTYLDLLPSGVGGGGFFTGYWLTTGDPEKSFESASFSNAIFVGGWYTTATKFSMTSGTSGVHVPPLSTSPTVPCASSSSSPLVVQLQQ